MDRDLEIMVAEPSEQSRHLICNTMGIELFSSLEAAIKQYKFDVAFICSPNHMHVPHAKILAEAGCHLFVEKPLSLDRNEAISLAPILKQSGIALMVGCNLRFHKGVQTIADVLQSGMIGRALYARAQFAHYLPNWRPGQDYRQTYSANSEQGGGILLDDIHEADYLCWLLGEVTSVSGFLPTIGNLDIDVEDVAEYVLWHGDKLYSQIHADYLRRDKARSCELVGTEGSVIWQSRGKNPEQVKVELYNAASDDWEVLFTDESYDLNRQYVDEVEYFLECVAEGRIPMNGLTDAVKLIEVLDKVREASRAGRVLEMRKV